MERGNAELRELAQGILQGALAHGGLRAGVRSVAARLDLPAQVDLRRDRRCRSHRSRARGMGDRVTALGGRLKIESPAGNGMLVATTLPLSAG